LRCNTIDEPKKLAKRHVGVPVGAANAGAASKVVAITNKRLGSFIIVFLLTTRGVTNITNTKTL